MRSESTAYISFFAKQFHSPRLPIVHNFHSLLRHLLTSEFAVLLFDCERNKPAAESIPQLFSYLGATVFFAAFFLKRKRVPLRTPRTPYFFRSSSILARPVKRIERRLLATISQRISTLPTRTASLPARVRAVYSILRERSPAGQP